MVKKVPGKRSTTVINSLQPRRSQTLLIRIFFLFLSILNVPLKYKSNKTACIIFGFILVRAIISIFYDTDGINIKH